MVNFRLARSTDFTAGQFVSLIIYSGKAACLLNEHLLVTNKGKGNHS